MDIIFNELSAMNAASSIFDAKIRMASLLKISKLAFEKGFKKIRFNDNFYESDLAEHYKIKDWLHDQYVPRLYKDLFYSVKAQPFIDPYDEHTTDKFIEGYFYYNENDEEYLVEGLAVAYLTNTLSISFDSHEKWNRSKIDLKYITDSTQQIEVNHFSKEEHLVSHSSWFEALFTTEIIETNVIIEEKQINLRDDHGKDFLLKFCEKIIRSPYVINIVNSLPFNPKTKNFIKFYNENGLIEIVLTRTDKGLGVVVQTTGRNKTETRLIAEILKTDFEKEY